MARSIPEKRASPFASLYVRELPNGFLLHFTLMWIIRDTVLCNEVD